MIFLITGYIYAIGGCGDGNKWLKTVERYDPKKNIWEYVSAMQFNRRGLTAAFCRNEIYAIVTVISN